MARWSSIDAEGVHLATIRVYHNAKNESGKSPRILLMLPPPPENPDEPGEEFELDMVNESVENQFVIAEREKEPGTASRARTTILTGRVKHECSLRPSLNDKYRQLMKKRTAAANRPQRTIKRIEDEHPGDRGTINRLTSGVTNTTGFADLIVSSLLSVSAACLIIYRRNPSKNRRRANSSAWPVCPATSSSICSLAYSANASIGLSSSCVSGHNSPRRTSRRCSARLRLCTEVENIMALGSLWRISRVMGYVLHA